MHLDVELSLWRNLVEAATASVALYIHNAQAVACVLAYALEARQQTRVYLCLKLLSLSLKHLLLLAGLQHNLVQLVLLLLKSLLTVGHKVVGACKLAFLVLHLYVCLANLLVAKLYLKALKLNLLSQGVVLAVVAHLVELFLIAFHALLGLLYLALLLHDSLLKVCDIVLDILDTRLQSGYLILKVLHLKR